MTDKKSGGTGGGERVTKARRKAQEEGRRRLQAVLSLEASQLLERLRPSYKSEAALIEAALKALSGSNILTDREILDMLETRLKGADTLKGPKTVKDNQLTGKIRVPPTR